MKTLTNYPHLPLLTMPQALSVFEFAKVPQVVLSTLTGYSRIAFFKWSKRRGTPRPLAIETVSTLAYRVLAAIKDSAAPFPKGTSAADIIAALTAGKTELHNRTAQELLPSKWAIKTKA